MTRKSLVLVATLSSFAASGCFLPVPSGMSTEDLVDADGDGFVELKSPEEVTTDLGVSIRLVNTITRAEAEQLAGQDIPDFLTVTAEMTIVRTYANGETLVDPPMRESLGPFELSFEAPCPDRVETTIAVTATAPFLGSFDVFSQTFTASSIGERADAVFECGKVITVEVSLNQATGLPTADIAVTDEEPTRQ
jgi:hypothetical protein